MADAAVKFPSARQDVFYTDPQTGKPVFTRPWFLFLQAVWQRQGGAIAPTTPDVEGSLFEDAGNSETQAMVFALAQDTGQSPLAQLVIEQQSTLLALQTQLDETRDKLAELTKAVNDINQGVLL